MTLACCDGNEWKLLVALPVAIATAEETTVVLTTDIGSEAELVLGEPEKSTAVEVEFSRGIEENAVLLDEMTLVDTDREMDPGALSDSPNDLNTDVGTKPWVLPPSTDSTTLSLTCGVWVTITEDGAIEATTLELWLAEATVPSDELVSTAVDEEWATEVVLFVSPTARFFRRLLIPDNTDDEATYENDGDGRFSEADDLLSAGEIELDRATGILLLVRTLTTLVWDNTTDDWGSPTLVLTLDGIWMLEDKNNCALEAEVLFSACEDAIGVLVLVGLRTRELPGLPLDTDATIARLALGDTWMFVDEGISGLEAEESTSAIVLDWTTEEFGEYILTLGSTEVLALLVSVTPTLSCEDTAVKVLCWLTVAIELSNTEGEDMLVVTVLSAAKERFPVVVADDIKDILVLFAIELSNTEEEGMLVVTVLSAAKERFPLVVADDIKDILVLFITNTSEDSKTFVSCDVLATTCVSLEVPERVIFSVSDEALVWTILALFAGKIDPSRDCVGTSAVDTAAILDMTEELLGMDWGPS